ncbi:MAG: YjaG family protein [Marinobacter sp.]|nr:YjaG family protein [Marinobacter sp.]
MNANQFLKSVAQLQGWRECAFLLALAERSFPNYALFAEAVGLKTGGKMRQLLDLGWESLQKETNEAAVPQLLGKLEGLCPSVDDYDAYGVYPAFDFCQLLEQALLNRLNPDKHRATDASQLATRTVMDFVEMSEGEGLDDNELVRLFEHHPLLKDDKLFQRDLVLALKRQRVPREDFIAELREQAANGGVSNLGIALDS